MSHLCIFLLVFYSILITYQSAGAVNSENRFLFINNENSRGPSLIDFKSHGSNDYNNDNDALPIFTNSGGVNSNFNRQKRESSLPISFRSDTNLPRNISAVVSTIFSFSFLNKITRFLKSFFFSVCVCVLAYIWMPVWVLYTSVCVCVRTFNNLFFPLLRRRLRWWWWWSSEREIRFLWPIKNVDNFDVVVVVQWGRKKEFFVRLPCAGCAEKETETKARKELRLVLVSISFPLLCISFVHIIIQQMVGDDDAKGY